MGTITRTIALKLDDGEQVFPVKEIDFFNLVCELEGVGVDVMSLTTGGLERSKLFTTVRAIAAVLLGVPQVEAGKLIGEHMHNGGALEDVLEVFTGAMQDADFGKARVQPQDHQKAVVSKGRKTTKK